MNLFARIGQALGLRSVTTTESTKIRDVAVTATKTFEPPAPPPLSVESVADDREKGSR